MILVDRFGLFEKSEVLEIDFVFGDGFRWFSNEEKRTDTDAPSSSFLCDGFWRVQSGENSSVRKH